MAKREKPGVILYFDLIPVLQHFTAEEKGLLFDAILDYGKNEVVPDFNGRLEIAWSFIQPRLAADDAAYQEKCKKATENIRKRWNKTDTDEYGGIPPNTDYTNTNTTQHNTTQLNSNNKRNEGENTVFPDVHKPMTEGEFETERARCMKRLEEY
jgi:hypothetical protein